MSVSQSIRAALPDDRASIHEVAVSSGLFAAEEVSFLDPMFDGYLDGSLEGHQWVVAVEKDKIVAAAYYAPEPYSFRMVNLYFLAVHPTAQGTGIGTRLLNHIEAALRELGIVQTLIVETSSTEKFAPTRAFYQRRGFDEEATIRRFYGPNDHKVVFWKSLVD